MTTNEKLKGDSETLILIACSWRLDTKIDADKYVDVLDKIKLQSTLEERERIKGIIKKHCLLNHHINNLCKEIDNEARDGLINE